MGISYKNTLKNGNLKECASVGRSIQKALERKVSSSSRYADDLNTLISDDSYWDATAGYFQDYAFRSAVYLLRRLTSVYLGTLLWRSPEFKEADTLGDEGSEITLAALDAVFGQVDLRSLETYLPEHLRDDKNLTSHWDIILEFASNYTTISFYAHREGYDHP